MEGSFNVLQDHLMDDSSVARHDSDAEHGGIFWLDDLYTMPVDARGIIEPPCEDESQLMTPTKWLSWVLPTIPGTPQIAQDRQNHETDAGLASFISSLHSAVPMTSGSPDLADKKLEAASVSPAGASSSKFERKPFQCNLCRVGFNQHFNMLKHKRVFHGLNKNHGCLKCGVKFYEPEALQRHIVKVHERKKQKRKVKTGLADSEKLQASKSMGTAFGATGTATGSILPFPDDLHTREQHHRLGILPELTTMEPHDLSLIQSSMPTDCGFNDMAPSLSLLPAMEQYEDSMAGLLPDGGMLTYSVDQLHPALSLEHTGDEQRQGFDGSGFQGGEEERDSHDSLAPLISVNAESGLPVPLHDLSFNMNDNSTELESHEEEHHLLSIFALRVSANAQGSKIEIQEEKVEEKSDADSALEGNHKCDECPKWYMHRRSLLAHRRATGHQGAEPTLERTHVCEDCGAVYVHRRSLLSHCRKTGCKPPTAHIVAGK